MLALISPAKKLDFSAMEKPVSVTLPALLPETEKLVKIARKQKVSDLKRLMGISDKLAELNVDRFKKFSTPFTAENAKPAAYAFNGDTYAGLEARSLDDDDMEFAQSNLRILSGLYGLLRPLDLMQAYRLEMGTKLANTRGESLYDFWGDRITNEINSVCMTEGHEFVINLASNEYVSAVNLKKLKVPLITPVFKEIKDGQAKIIGMVAKRARGMMARYIIQHRLSNPEDLKKFTEGGYAFQPDLSDERRWEFSRVSG